MMSLMSSGLWKLCHASRHWTVLHKSTSRVSYLSGIKKLPNKEKYLRNRMFSMSAATRTSLTSQRQNTVTINFVDRKGQKTTVKAALNDTLLDVVVDNNLDIESFGVCEGTLGCSTCHVILDQKIFDLVDKTCAATCEEMDMLDLACGLTETSRLGCQVEISKDMDGCTVHVPKEAIDARDL